MAKQGYKYRFWINIARSIQNNSLADKSSYYQAIEITLYMKGTTAGFITYKDVESRVEKYLYCYTGKCINDVEPFINLEPTLENIADVFYDQIKILLKDLQLDLFELEIQEKSTRVFSVSERYYG